MRSVALLILLFWYFTLNAAIEPTDLQINSSCGRSTAVPTDWWLSVQVIVPKKYDLTDRKVADEVVMAAYKKAWAECAPPPGFGLWGPGNMIVNEEGYRGDKPDRVCTFTEKHISCPDYQYNAPARRRWEQKMAAQVARERAAEEQQRRNRLEAQARLDHKIQSFADKHGADGGWLDWKRLRANPFSYEGKILVFNASFEKMVSPTSGIFNGVLVTGLPRNAFLQPSDVLLAGKVRGTSDIKTESGGTGQVPHVEYVAHVSCQERNCKDYAGRLRK